MGVSQNDFPSGATQNDATQNDEASNRSESNRIEFSLYRFYGVIGCWATALGIPRIDAR